jgi:hypothetical protein
MIDTLSLFCIHFSLGTNSLIIDVVFENDF